MRGTGGRFQQIQGVNEQQDFSNGLKTMMATDAAESPLSRIAGERFSPSQVCGRGELKKIQRDDKRFHGYTQGTEG